MREAANTNWRSGLEPSRSMHHSEQILPLAQFSCSSLLQLVTPTPPPYSPASLPQLATLGLNVEALLFAPLAGLASLVAHHESSQQTFSWALPLKVRGSIKLLAYGRVMLKVKPGNTARQAYGFRQAFARIATKPPPTPHLRQLIS